jgi:hypothetical protein
MGIVIFHAVVHRIRKAQRVQLMSIARSMMESVIFVAAFIIIMDVLGMRNSAVRGDFVLYINSGIFLYLTHTQSVDAISGAETSSSPLMQHGPMKRRGHRLHVFAQHSFGRIVRRCDQY